MTAQSDFSTRNIENSLAMRLTRPFLTAGYLIYWLRSDGVETPDGFYGTYSTNQAATLANTTFAARVAAAKGLLTIRGPLTASPAFVTRPTISGQVGPEDEVPIPSLAIEIGGAAPTGGYELGLGPDGTQLKWRARTISISAFCRTLDEHDLFKDRIVEWLDEDVVFDILDHEHSSLAVLGNVRVVSPNIESHIRIPGPQFTTFAVEFVAHLEYVA